MNISIDLEVIKCFNKAIRDEFNLRPGFGSTSFWNFVESDMYMGLRAKYNSEYIDDCFEALADQADAQFQIARLDDDGSAVYNIGVAA